MQTPKIVVNWKDFLCGLKCTVINVRTCPKCGYMIISALQVEPVDTTFKPIMIATQLHPQQPCHNCN